MDLSKEGTIFGEVSSLHTMEENLDFLFPLALGSWLLGLSC
jgi:hypothetical protein